MQNPEFPDDRRKTKCRAAFRLSKFLKKQIKKGNFTQYSQAATQGFLQKSLRCQMILGSEHVRRSSDVAFVKCASDFSGRIFTGLLVNLKTKTLEEFLEKSRRVSLFDS